MTTRPTVRPTFDFGDFARPPRSTVSPTAAPSLAPTAAPSLAPTQLPSAMPVAAAAAQALPIDAEFKYSGAPCWVWILIGTLLGIAFGILLSYLWSKYASRNHGRKNANADAATETGVVGKPFLGHHDPEPTTLSSQVELGTMTTSQPAGFFPGQSLRSETRPAPQQQHSESVLIRGPEEHKKPEVRLEDLEKGMTLEGTSYQYFHPDDGQTLRRDNEHDESPRVSFTFGND